ncbi:MAG: BBE domain-containing protein, partial [Bacteroidia bacterium]
DSSVPTRVYFDKSYERLKQIKIDHSRDPYNHFRSRKTIM